MSRYLSVKNFERFQHYKDRNPPWIKLYYELLDDYDFACLQDASKWLAIGIWMLASRTDNRVPADPKWLAGKLSTTEPVDFTPLLSAGFVTISDDASNTLADCEQDATPHARPRPRGEAYTEETYTEEEELITRGAREDPTPPHLSLVPAANGNGKTQPLPARRDRTSAAIRDQLAQVHAELAEGSRTRLKAQQQRSVAAGMVFAYWASVTNSERSLLDDKREKLIIARLMENGGDVFELLYACDGALRDPWHNGEKDQTRRMGIEQILRNRGKVEELAGKVPGYRKGEPHRMAEKYASIFNTEHAA